MRIATWNINGLRARFDFLLHWLRTRQPDIVGLQELKLTDESFPYAELEAAGYRAVAHTQKAWNGVAILSREEAGDPPAGAARRGGTRCAADQRQRRRASVHYGLLSERQALGHPDFPKKLHWLDALARFLKEQHRPSEPVVLCGDLNLCPTALDTWNEVALRGEIFHTDEERARFQNLIDWGLCDLYRELMPEGSHVFLVGLPGRGISQEPGIAHRLSSGHSNRAGASAKRRDRPGIPKEERRPGSLGPRTGFRGFELRLLPSCYALIK